MRRATAKTGLCISGRATSSQWSLRKSLHNNSFLLDGGYLHSHTRLTGLNALPRNHYYNYQGRYRLLGLSRLGGGA